MLQQKIDNFMIFFTKLLQKTILIYVYTTLIFLFLTQLYLTTRGQDRNFTCERFHLGAPSPTPYYLRMTTHTFRNVHYFLISSFNNILRTTKPQCITNSI